MIVGVDPGVNGAITVYDHVGKQVVQIDDMPSFSMVVGKKTRKRINASTLLSMFEFYKMQGCVMCVIEAVGGRPQQSASAGYVFGYSVGLIYMACIAVKLPIETVPAASWKKIMSVPGKRDANGDAKKFAGMILARADEMFPECRDKFRGPKGGIELDRCESAMLAKFGGDHMLRTMTFEHYNVKASELEMVYKRANTGG